MRFFKREPRATLETPTSEPTRGKKIDLGGKPFTSDLVHRDELEQSRFIVFENVKPYHFYDNDFKNIPKGATATPEQRTRRMGIQFPHHDGFSSIPEVVMLRSQYKEKHDQNPGVIEDPEHPSATADRTYVEPYTVLFDADELWDAFVQYIKRKNPGLLERIMSSLKKETQAESQKESAPSDKAIEKLRDDIEKVGTRRVGDKQYDPHAGEYQEGEVEGAASSSWKQHFFNGFFGKDTFRGPAHITREQIREFMLFAIDSGCAYLHTWKPNQVLVFDNMCMMHGLLDLTEKGGSPNFYLQRGFYDWEGDTLKKS